MKAICRFVLGSCPLTVGRQPGMPLPGPAQWGGGLGAGKWCGVSRIVFLSRRKSVRGQVIIETSRPPPERCPRRNGGGFSPASPGLFSRIAAGINRRAGPIRSDPSEDGRAGRPGCRVLRSDGAEYPPAVTFSEEFALRARHRVVRCRSLFQYLDEASPPRNGERRKVPVPTLPPDFFVRCRHCFAPIQEGGFESCLGQRGACRASFA
jgi:hypothetical protein